jgi:hypothetical protein
MRPIFASMSPGGSSQALRGEIPLPSWIGDGLR